MCLVAFAWQVDPHFPIVLAANRDEFFAREAQAAHFWKDHPDVFGGRDLSAGGTWLALHAAGKISLITNYRAPGAISPQSRGQLVLRALYWDQTPTNLFQDYGYFNLIEGTLQTMRYYNHPTNRFQVLRPGIYTLSNAELNTPWPKSVWLESRFKELIELGVRSPEPFLELMNYREPIDDTQLPDTGVGLEWERLLAPVFVQSAHYGTRASTFVRIDKGGNVLFHEQSWDQHGSPAKTVREQFSFHPIS